MPFHKRDYENRYTSFDGYKYQSENAFSDSDLNVLDVLRSDKLLKRLNMKTADSWQIVIEDMGGAVAARFNPFEEQILLDTQVLKSGLIRLRNHYLHELTHKIVGPGHGTNFFLIMAILYCRYYAESDTEQIIGWMSFYDLQDVRFFDGSKYYDVEEIFDLSDSICDYQHLDFSQFIKEIEYWASSKWSIEVIEHYLKGKEITLTNKRQN